MKSKKDVYKYLVTLAKGSEVKTYKYYSMSDIEYDLAYDLHKYIQNGYTVKISKIR